MSGSRRLTIAPSSQLNVGQLSYHIPEILQRANEVQDLFRPTATDWNRNDSIRRELGLEICAAPVSPVFSVTDSRRPSRQRLILRRPTISIQDDGKIIIGWFFHSILFLGLAFRLQPRFARENLRGYPFPEVFRPFNDILLQI